MNDTTHKTGLSYQDAGVDIAAGNAFVQCIKPIAAQTKRSGVVEGLGGFGALFELPLHRYQQPLLVSSTDGVGTKLKLALALNQHHTIGIDLVAMCVNDIIVQGAEPLFFLDYFASAALDLPTATAVLEGIGQGCQQAGVALIGGETAEMPGMYHGNDYDLAGFSVGIVEKNRLLHADNVQVGDALIALASSGAHANGFSLIRAILDRNQLPLDTPFGDSTLGQTLLTPTRIYVKPLLQLLQQYSDVHAMAHITGGGLVENLPRVLPAHTRAIIDTNSWEWPPVFRWLQTHGAVATEEMYRTFNCGIGMILCVPAGAADSVIKLLNHTGEHAWLAGHVAASDAPQSHVTLV